MQKGVEVTVLTPRYGVIAQNVCFQLHFHQAVLQHIAYADNADKPLSGFHRQMTCALSDHYLRHLVDRILERTDDHASGHEPVDGYVGNLLACAASP